MSNDKNEDEKRDQLVGFLSERQDLIQDLLKPHWPSHYQFDSALPTADVLAIRFLSDAKFRALQLGTWLGSTDGVLLTEAVSLALPGLYDPEFSLLVDGLKLAADSQASEGSKRAGLAGIAVLAALFLIAASTIKG